MAWMSVDEVNQKIQSVASIQLSRWPVSKIQPEVFLLGNSASNWTGTGADGAYFKRRSYEINALKIPSRVPGRRYEGALDHLSVIITGNILGNELIGPEATLHFAELFLRAVADYELVDSAQKTYVYIPAKDITIGGYTIAHGDLEKILETVNIWIVPMVNPGGRDEQLSGWSTDYWRGRANPNGVCLDRNYDIAWHFKDLFLESGWRQFATSLSGKKDDPGIAKLNYQGPSPESEPETKAVVGLLSPNVQAPGATGDPSITWLFDIHGQLGIARKVSYPWSWAEIQTQRADMCIRNPYYNPPPPAREGYVSLAAHLGAYGEYLPPRTDAQVKTLAQVFTTAAESTHKQAWTPPGQGGVLYPCVGAIDDYFLWLDRNHCRAFTVECADLQPDAALQATDMDEIAAGLFAAIKQIKDWVLASSNPRQELSRLSTDQLTCP